MSRPRGSYKQLWPKLEFSPFDLGWLTAIMEGEGSFIRCSSKNSSPRAKLNMTDKEPINKAASLMKTTVRGPYASKPGMKPQWHTGVSGPRALELGIFLYEYFSPRRQEQVRNMLTSWEHRERIS
jgi:hypothetical protein